MSQIIPINIPTYISDQNYNPSRVLPRLFYYNGLIDCETYYFESGSLTKSGVVKTQTAFPYFDNYNVVSGSFPTAGSKSLLFNNEAVAYGSLPSSSLFTEYWDSYVSLLYNPKTRLLTAKAIIPLADYIKMELNDIVNFRGNYYHLRAINNYSLKTGDCELQLLGPIIPDALSGPPPPPPTPPTTASISWTNITDSDVTSSFRIYDNGSLKVSSSITQGSSLFVSQSHIVNAELDVTPFPSEGSVTMSLNVNGGATIAVSSSINTTLTASFVVTGGVDYYITGAVNAIIPPPAQLSWSFNEGANTTASFSVYESSSILTTLTSSASGNALSSGSKIIKVELGPVTGSWISGTSMSINVNGGTTLAVSGSTDTIISASFTASAGNIYYITGSSNYNITYVSGAKVIFDFGNSASYPGSGSTVTNLGSAGTGSNGNLINTPTYLTSSGGILRLNNASSQRIDYTASITPDTTTIVIWQNVDANFSKDTGFPTLRGNNGYIAAFLGGGKQFTPILFNTIGGGSTYGSATSTPADIQIWHQYAQTVAYSAPNTTATTFLDGNASSASQSQNFNRSGTGSGSAHLGFDNAVGDRYANGYIMAYLQYDRVLTPAELTENYEIFERRF